MIDRLEAPHNLPTQTPSCGALLGLGDGRIAVGWGQPVWMSNVGSGPSFYAPDFLLQSPRPFLKFPHHAIVSSAQLFAAWGREDETAHHCWTWCEPQMEAFAATFFSIQEEIAQGSLRKAVPVVFAHSERPANSGWFKQVLSRLLLLADRAFIYGFWSDEEGVLGASPELLFHHDHAQRELRTMALAGTRDLSEGTNQEFLANAKERAEHQWVVRGLDERLAPLGTVEQEPTEVIRAGSLRHLCTRVKVRNLVQVDFVDLVGRLHPTPALGAYPLEAARIWLQRQPSRGRFGAPFAYVEPQRFSHCVVSIRNIEWGAGRVRLGSGCGIVAGSDLQREWQELAHKRRAVCENLNLQSAVIESC